MTELQEATPLDTAEDLFKADAMRLLVEPLDALSGLFMTAFREHDPILSQVNVFEGIVLITFITRRPESDTIRRIVFSLYHRHWGGKPDEIECVYKDAIGFSGLVTSRSPTMLCITVKPEAVTKLLRTSKDWRVLDFKDFDDWIKDLPPKHWPGSKSKDKVLIKDKGKTQCVTVFENGLSGEPIPEVHFGLFRV